jgi:hypothetical protein
MGDGTHTERHDVYHRVRTTAGKDIQYSEPAYASPQLNVFQPNPTTTPYDASKLGRASAFTRDNVPQRGRSTTPFDLQSFRQTHPSARYNVSQRVRSTAPRVVQEMERDVASARYNGGKDKNHNNKPPLNNQSIPDQHTGMVYEPILTKALGVINQVLDATHLRSATNPLGLTGMMHDMRIISVAMMMWIVVVYLAFGFGGVFSNSFLDVGPSKHLLFFNRPLDTWAKWTLVATYGICDQIIVTVAANTIYPWVNHEVQDHKQKSIQYSYYWVHAIISADSVFQSLALVLRFGIITSQLVMVSLMLLSRLVVGYLVTRVNIADKKCGVSDTDAK